MESLTLPGGSTSAGGSGRHFSATAGRTAVHFALPDDVVSATASSALLSYEITIASLFPPRQPPQSGQIPPTRVPSVRRLTIRSASSTTRAP